LVPNNWEIRCQNDTADVPKPMFYNTETNKFQKEMPKIITEKGQNFKDLVEKAKNGDKK
jgi:hypothetical protein